MTPWRNHRVQVKNHAKISLIGNFLKGIFAAALTLLFTLFAMYFMPMPAISLSELRAAKTIEDIGRLFIPQNIEVFLALSAVAMLLYLLLTAPLKIGKHRYYLLAVRGEKPPFRTVLIPFMDLKLIFKSCALSVISFIWLALLAVLFFAPAVALYVFSPILGPLAVYGSYACFAVAMFFYLLVSTPFKLAPFVLADKPEIGAFKSILVATKRLHGVKIEFLVFNFSFFLWQFFFSLNIPGTLLIEPYISASMAGFYETIDACKAKKQ